MLMQGIRFFEQGGSVMYVLLLCSIFVVAMGIERAMYFSRHDDGRDFSRQLSLLLTRGNYEMALEMINKGKGKIAEIIKSALSFQVAQQDKAASFMEIQSGVALAGFKKHLYYLSVVVTLAPLLGLLGTIAGMISAFSIFNVESGQAGAITGDVGAALIATATGLCVAIIALSIHAYFVQRVDSIITDMEQCFSLVEVHFSSLKNSSEYTRAEKDGDANALA